MNDIEPDVIEYNGFRDLEPDGVLEQPFNERYNSFLEVPIAVVAAVLIPVAILFLLIQYLDYGKKRNTAPLPVTYLSDGEDEKGDGSPGSGGEEALNLGQAPSAADLERLPKVADINTVKEELEQGYKIDGVTDVDISDSKAAAIGTLHTDLRKKITGSQKGSGRPGTGGPATPNPGPGGKGADSTRARALRWIIKFDRGGRDYVNQIGGLGGIILMQAGSDNSKMYIFRTPQNAGPPKVASDADHAEMQNLLLFEDLRGDSVRGVAEALGLDFVPPMFMVRFPKELEAKLEKLEREKNGRDPKDIKETVYRVVKSGGGYDLYVISQTLR